jgi:lipoyl(octanoyl) transferase
VRAARQAGAIPDTLLLLEHPPVYTRGRRSLPGELPLGEDWYRAQGIDIIDVDRGGRLTYHGPGQLVGYPIMAITDVIAYLRTIEAALVATLADAGLDARGRPEDGPDYTGVWTGDRKIASIGVHVSRGVTTHGFAINVANDLEPFGWVVACGLADVSMTSVAQEGGRTDAVRATVAARFAEAFERVPVELSRDDLVAALASAGVRQLG